MCNPDYLMLSYEDQRCVLASECPPVECTRPNEVWDPSPSNCLWESCEDRNRACEDPSSGPPRCVCKPGHYRNQKDICVPASECETCNGDPNAIPHDCPSSCPSTCDRPDSSGEFCIQACDPSGCVCKPGYILTRKGGICVKPEECPNYQQCNGDRNATLQDCPSACQATCAEPDTDRPCILICLPPGCVCKPGFLKLEGDDGPCIKPEDCPGGSPTCGANKTYVPCKYGCPTNYCPQSDSRAVVACSISFPCFPGCMCNPGYLMVSYEDRRCVLSSECPPVECTRPNEEWDPYPSNCLRESCVDRDRECTDPSNGPPRCVCKRGYYRNENDECVPATECETCNGDPNAIPHDCPSSCPPTCLEPDTSDVLCIQACEKSGCECRPGYILTKVGGKCVKPEECPNKEMCNGDRNATFQECPSACQATCNAPDTDRPCIAICLPPGCVCKPGYLRITKDGPCIKPGDCPGGSPTCGANKTYVACKVGCPTNYCPKSDMRAMVACSMPYPCPPGCVCIKNHLMLNYEDQRCVLASECPPVKCTRPNEVWNPTPSNCFLERCEDIGAVCHNKYPSPPRCVCKPGYYRNKDDICIPASECPLSLNCGYNEVAVKCRTICPPQNCEIAYTEYGCDGYRDICEPGCDCLPNYLRNGSGICILNDNCPYPSTPVCGINEIARDCKRVCPPQTCEGRHALYKCRSDIPCEPGCDCVPNYLRNSKGVCIPANQCDLPSTCSIPDECIRTCAAPNPPNCPYDPPKTNIDGCECMEGYILSELGGKCIRIEECNVSCNGDPHAITKQCPLPCPSTCDAPDASPCKKMCEPIGCECQSGYMIDKKSGKCVLPEECPGGNPCGENEVFQDCKSRCPRDYCPVDDSRQVYICDLFPRCLPGCACKLNYKRLSYQDDRCIVASDCPPVKCTRPNEVWNGCPEECFSGYCEDREYQDVPCNSLILNCQPKCICKKDTFRNASDICVPACECPPLTPVCNIPEECIRTCANPNPPDCPYEPPQNNIDGCECKDGYILSEVGGKCIPIGDCPKDLACNGDPNAQPKKCPAPCPSTCDSPNEVICYKMCEPIGCECKPGYLLSNTTGQCILPDQCPSGNPCGPNSHFASCIVDCPTNYCPVDDNRNPVSCDPSSGCTSGCVCNLNHRWLSREDKRCVVASDCPPVDCTRPNEVWDGCPSDCFSGYCEDREYQDAICYTLLLNCQPKCVCKRDTFRNASDICVPACECPPLPPVCSVPDNCIRTCASPNPPDCPYEPAETNIDGCECMEGYILSERGGKCIRIEDCPKDVACNGDPNAQTKRCPAPCPSTCKSPDAQPCKKKCEPIGCECKPGYMLSNSTGKCILPNKCPGGNPCGKNANFVACKVNCPTDYCPVDDSRAVPLCNPGPNCLSGCVCKLNHKRLSREDRRCIVASDCPPVTCTRPNEKWSKCPSACLAEKCEDIDNQPSVCNTLVLNCQPQCICHKNFFRNATDICVCPDEC